MKKKNFKLTKRQLSKFSEAITSFDFDRQEEIMGLLNWTWGDGNIPTAKEMAETVTNLAYNAYEALSYDNEAHFMYSETGGFKVTVFDDDVCIIEFIANESGNKYDY